MERLQGQLAGSSIHHANDGYLYLCYRTNNDNTQYFRCRNWRQGCLGRGNISRDNIFRLTCEHDHPPDRNEAILLRDRHNLMNLARNPNFGPIQHIFNNVRNNPQMEQLERQRLFRALTRARSQTLPTVQNLAELRTVMEHPSFSWLTSYGDHLEHTGYRGSLQAPDGSQVVLFSSHICEHFLMVATSIFIIKTSSIIGNEEHDLITVATFWDRNVISLAWLLFESNSADALSAGFSLLRTHSPTYHFSQAFCRRGKIADAFHRVYPTVKIQPSFFDFIYELKNNTHLSEYMRILLQNPVGMKIFKLCCASLLLPSDLMQIGFNQIVTEALTAGEEVSSNSMHLFNFIESEWLSSDTLHLNLCGNFEGTHYGIAQLELKSERHLKQVNDFYYITKYITSAISKAHQKIATVVSGSRLPHAVPIPLAADPPLWNIMRATGFPAEITVANILQYVSNKLVI